MSTPFPRNSRRSNAPIRVPCQYPGCKRWFGNKAGLTQHTNRFHPVLQQPVSSRSISSQNPSADQVDNSCYSNEPSGAEPGSPPAGADTEEVDSESRWHGPGGKVYRNYHPYLTARPCDSSGNFLPDGTPPQPYSEKALDDWSPFGNRAEFELADLLYTQIQMSATHVNKLLDIFTAYMHLNGGQPPFSNCSDLYDLIDRTRVGDIAWENFGVKYSGERPDHPLPWMDDVYDVWMRDPESVIGQIIDNPGFTRLMDLTPFREFETASNDRRWQDFMSGDWAWEEADIIAEDPATHGATLVPIILGSDKTTVSVATGQHDYYPLYLSVGNLHNTARRAHKNGVTLIAFLAMPKTTKEHAATPAFRKFRRQLFHRSLSKILERLKRYMSTWKVMRFSDGYFRRVIFSLGPYIADYEEQVLLACIVRNWCAKCMARNKHLDDDALYRCREHTDILVEDINTGVLWNEYGIVADLVPFTNDFPCADIYRLLSPDLLHQIIKGAFKDHLVDWIEKYIRLRYGEAVAQVILDDIDRRIAAVAPFAGLRRFPQGRNFKQWTGDDSKALMKVYLPAIEGHVPPEMVRTIRAFLEFCYLVRQNVITEQSIGKIQEALDRFYQHRIVFMDEQVVTTFSLPRQHSMKHYIDMIRLFGAPNGLCSSITESKHIKAVKEPYRRSNRNQPLGQMLLINQRLDKLAAARSDFMARGMLDKHILADILQSTSTLSTGKWSPASPNHSEPVDIDPTAVEAHVHLAKTIQRNRARNVIQLGAELHIPNITHLVSRFLFEQRHQDEATRVLLLDAPESIYPQYDGKICVFNSASAMFYAPSDVSGIHGMRREFIRSTPLWRNEGPRFDCAFVNANPETAPMNGLEVVRILAFFSFHFQGNYYPCAAVHWYDRVGDEPDNDTGMWLVRPQFNQQQHRGISIIHVDSIYRAAQLIPVYRKHLVPPNLQPHHSYDSFRLYYVNKFADHHTFEIAS
ncbi:hypothetical protein L210DRAFT_3615092 [Boletus edulis BED1]|uniref:C2H2-type domain-containing protein n=1 Tax=Boletus edulis BED1 TaxID=1328754 RepID=A0AAD4BEY2_BOLED|nr:hypothetical protein L210DRAFT_3615092 [Boletus edulis BED1]